MLPNEDATVLDMKPKSFLSIDVNSKIPSDFVPHTVVLQIESSNGQKYSLPMHRSGAGFHAEISPSRSDMAAAFNYAGGEFRLTFLCGDNLIPTPLRIPLLTVKMDFWPSSKGSCVSTVFKDFDVCNRDEYWSNERDDMYQNPRIRTHSSCSL